MKHETYTQSGAAEALEILKKLPQDKADQFVMEVQKAAATSKHPLDAFEVSRISKAINSNGTS